MDVYDDGADVSVYRCSLSQCYNHNTCPLEWPQQTTNMCLRVYHSEMVKVVYTQHLICDTDSRTEWGCWITTHWTVSPWQAHFLWSRPMLEIVTHIVGVHKIPTTESRIDRIDGRQAAIRQSEIALRSNLTSHTYFEVGNMMMMISMGQTRFSLSESWIASLGKLLTNTHTGNTSAHVFNVFKQFFFWWAGHVFIVYIAQWCHSWWVF